MFDWLLALLSEPVGKERMVLTPSAPRPGAGFKPHIYRPLNGGWGCRSWSHFAFGETPKEAYDNWVGVARYNSNATHLTGNANPYCYQPLNSLDGWWSHDPWRSFH